jgi:hypothetical protein
MQRITAQHSSEARGIYIQRNFTKRLTGLNDIDYDIRLAMIGIGKSGIETIETRPNNGLRKSRLLLTGKTYSRPVM